MYRFAIGRLQAGKRSRRLLSPLHVAAGCSLPLAAVLMLAAMAAGQMSTLAVLLVLACVALVGLGFAKTKSFRAGVWLPVVILIFLAAWSAGFLRDLCVPLRSVDGK